MPNKGSFWPLQPSCMIWKFPAGTSRRAGSCELHLSMTAWMLREPGGWRSMDLRESSISSHLEKVRLYFPLPSASQLVYVRSWFIQLMNFFLRFLFVLDLLDLDHSKTFYKPDWFDIVGSEVKCCKEAVCVIDMSSFTKFEISVST